MSVTKLTNTDREYLLSHSAKYMPDNPTLEGWSGERVRETFWYPVKIEFDWIQRLADETYALEAGLGGGTVVPAHATKADQDGDGNVIKDTYAKLAASQTFSGDNTFSGTVTLSSIAGTKTVTGSTTFQGANAYFGFLNGGASNNNHELHVYYTTYLHGASYSADIIPANTYTFGNSDKHWGAAHINNLYVYTAIKNGSYSLTLPSASGVLATEGYADAAEAAAKAYADAEVGKLVSGDYTAKKAKQDDMGNRIYSTYIQFAHVVNALTSDATNFPLSAYQGKVLKGYIDAINALLASNDEDLDTIQEIVAYVKNNKDLIDAITTSKVSVSDIVDAVTSQATNKPLSANQGYVLKGLIDALSSSKVAVLDIIDNLTSSTESAKPLSAKQGYVLKGLIDALDTQLNLALVNVTSIADTYSSSLKFPINKGDFVVHNLALYRAKQDISTAEEWISSHWEQVNIVELIKEKLSKGDYDSSTGVGFADKATLAKNLDTKVVQNDVDAYNFRTSGGSLEIGDTCKVGAIVGGSLGWNQQAQEKTYDETVNGIRIQIDGLKYTVTVSNATNFVQIDFVNVNVVAGHKYLVTGSNRLGSNSGIEVYLSGYSTGNSNEYILAATDSVTGARPIYFFVGQNTPDGTYAGYVQVFDLTAMLGSEIADYIYSLEQATAGAGVAWFRRYFPKLYYPYHAIGGFAHVQTKGKKYVGFNQWNEKWGNYVWNETRNGVRETNASAFGCKEHIKVLPNTTYYLSVGTTNSNFYVLFYDTAKNFISYSYGGRNRTFTTPSNCAYMTFYSYNSYSTTYNNDVCINFHYDGERDGEYEPYDENNYELDPIELIGIPHIDAQGNLYFDGNRYLPDGTVEEKLHEYSVTGNETVILWTTPYGDYIGFEIRGLPYLTQKRAVGFNNVGFANKDSGTAYNNFYYVNGSCYACIQKSLLSEETTYGFKAWMVANNLKLIYPKATPTISEATPYTDAQLVANWGTEEFLPPDGDTRPVEIPIGHETEYLTDLKSKVEIAPALPSSDGTYVCKVESGTAEYMPLGTWLGDNGYEKQLDYSSEITDSTGLSYGIKKAKKIGNMVTISIHTHNNGGGTRTAGTTLFTLGSNIRPSVATGFIVGAYINGEQTNATLTVDNTTGNCALTKDLALNEYIYWNVSFFVS